MQRWLYNVRAVMFHRDGATTSIQWWGRHSKEPPPPPPAPIAITNITLGRFIGQGRTTQYAGLSHAVMAEIPITGHPDYPKHYAEFAQRVHDRLGRRGRPLSWFVTALLSEVVVITEVMLAFMLSFNTPSVGLGCWSASFGVYAILSSLCWVLVMCFRMPGRVVTGLCYAFNTLALGWLVTVTVLVVSDYSSLSSFSLFLYS